MGELVHPQNYTGVLNLTVVFLIASSAILMNMAGVSHLVSLMPVGEGKDERLRSIQGDSWIPLAPVTMGLHKLLIHCFCYHRVLYLRSKSSTQSSCFYWGDSPKHAYECPVKKASTYWLYCCFYSPDLLFCFHWCISEQEKTMVSFVVFLLVAFGILVPILISRTP